MKTIYFYYFMILLLGFSSSLIFHHHDALGRSLLNESISRSNFKPKTHEERPKRYVQLIQNLGLVLLPSRLRVKRDALSGEEKEVDQLKAFDNKLVDEMKRRVKRSGVKKVNGKQVDASVSDSEMTGFQSMVKPMKEMPLIPIVIVLVIILIAGYFYNKKKKAAAVASDKKKKEEEEKLAAEKEEKKKKDLEKKAEQEKKREAAQAAAQAAQGGQMADMQRRMMMMNQQPRLF